MLTNEGSLSFFQSSFLIKNKKLVLLRTSLNGFIYAVHLPSIAEHTRYSCRQLNLGNPTAHERFHLMLLPSGPDMVHGFPLRRTQMSTPRAEGRLYIRTTSGRNSVLLERIASYKVPLFPHLARHFKVY